MVRNGTDARSRTARRRSPTLADGRIVERSHASFRTAPWKRSLTVPYVVYSIPVKLSVFTKIFADRTVEAAVDAAADLGYDGVELMCRSPHFPSKTTVDEANELGDRITSSGLEVPCLATYTGGYVGVSREEAEAELAELERFLELADAFDCDLVRHGPGGPPVHRATEDDYEEAVPWMRRAADLAAEYDKTIAIEIHGHRIVETANTMVKLIEMIDRDNVGAIHDAGNMYIVDADYARESIETLGDHLLHVHVKDERRVDDDSLPGADHIETCHGDEIIQPRRMGDGAIDYGAVIEALAEVGYDGHITAECRVPQNEPGDDRAIAAHELEALRELVASV